MCFRLTYSVRICTSDAENFLLPTLFILSVKAFVMLVSLFGNETMPVDGELMPSGGEKEQEAVVTVVNMKIMRGPVSEVHSLDVCASKIIIARSAALSLVETYYIALEISVVKDCA